jgi:hemerythrin superfamily protein
MSEDVIDLIMQDHREVERMFEQLKSDPATRAGLTPVLTTLLAAHSRAEEAEVYPVARDEADQGDDVAHSQEEHLLADQLLADLAGCDPASAEYDQSLTKLVDAVTHHVEEEEKTVLPGMRARLTDERRTELGRAFLASRAEHLGDQPEDITKQELERQASNAEISVGDRTKAELQAELRRHASE